MYRFWMRLPFWEHFACFSSGGNNATATNMQVSANIRPEVDRGQLPVAPDEAPGGDPEGARPLRGRGPGPAAQGGARAPR